MKKRRYRSYSRILSREIVIEILKTSKDLTHADLSRVDLGRLDLSGCDLSHSRLDYGWLKRTKFNTTAQL
jgi:uncharacterized protein YjbI with pentapeptide repeats